MHARLVLNEPVVSNARRVLPDCYLDDPDMKRRMVKFAGQAGMRKPDFWGILRNADNRGRDGTGGGICA
jgi:hypothetical protein